MEVIAAYRHISGDRFVDEDESKIMAIQHFEIDGHWISCDVAELRNDGPFLTIVLDRLGSEENYEYIERSLVEIEKLTDSLTADDWLDGTDQEKLILPVTRLRWVELVPA